MLKVTSNYLGATIYVNLLSWQIDFAIQSMSGGLTNMRTN